MQWRLVSSCRCWARRFRFAAEPLVSELFTYANRRGVGEYTAAQALAACSSVCYCALALRSVAETGRSTMEISERSRFARRGGYSIIFASSDASNPARSPGAWQILTLCRLVFISRFLISPSCASSTIVGRNILRMHVSVVEEKNWCKRFKNKFENPRKTYLLNQPRRVGFVFIQGITKRSSKNGSGELRKKKDLK